MSLKFLTYIWRRTMKSTQNLPSKLKELRKKNQYSQDYVAEQLNISRQAISRWENGKSYPDIDNLILLAQLYNVSVDDLLDNHCASTNPDDDATEKNSNITEIIGISVILFLASNLPFCAIPVSIAICIWFLRTKRNYKIVYLFCFVCFIIGIHEIFSFYTHYELMHGTFSVIPAN